MISTFIADHLALVRILLVSAGVVAVLVAAVLARHGRRGRRVAFVIFIISVLAMLGLTLAPDFSSSTASRACNFQPFSFWRDVSNIVLFFVPGLYAVVSSHRRVLVAAAIPLASAAIELCQAAIPAIGRRCDIDDWLANSTGGLAGVLVGMLVVLVAQRRQRLRSRHSNGR